MIDEYLAEMLKRLDEPKESYNQDSNKMENKKLEDLKIGDLLFQMRERYGENSVFQIFDDGCGSISNEDGDKALVFQSLEELKFWYNR